MEDNDPTGYKEGLKDLAPWALVGCAASVMTIASFPVFVAMNVNAFRIRKQIKAALSDSKS